MPVNRLLITMALPMIISMLVQALYNIVDSVFVAMINEDALTAVSIAFTMQNLMIAIASGMGVGINALLSRSLGEKNFKTVHKAALNGIFVEAIGCLLFVVLGLLIIKPFYAAQAGSGENAQRIIEYGKEYLGIVMLMGFGLFAQMTFERLLQATGKTMYTMVTQGTGAIINLIFDPIFIFVFKWGIAGAALATVLGQIVAAALALTFNLKINKEINFSVKGFRPSWFIISQILAVGIPSTIMISIGSVMTFCMNKILVVFSSTAVAVFGVYFKLNSFIFMPLFGMNNGMVPIISYNFGAKRRERVTGTIRYALIYAFSIMVIGTIIFWVFPYQLLGFFSASEDMLKIGVPALRIISMSFPLAAFAIVLSSVFQALGNGIYSMTVSIARQLIVLVPAAYILARISGFDIAKIDYVWFSYDLAEIMSIALSVFFFVRLYNKKLKHLE